MKKIDHIGIAVYNLEEASMLYEKLLGCPAYKKETVLSEGVNTAFFTSGSNKIELLEGIHNDSVIAKFIVNKGEGIHHIAFEVDNIFEEIIRLKNEGFIILNEIPHKGADNKWVVFIHPKSITGVLIELCQEIK